MSAEHRTADGSPHRVCMPSAHRVRGYRSSSLPTVASLWMITPHQQVDWAVDLGESGRSLAWRGGALLVASVHSVRRFNPVGPELWQRPLDWGIWPGDTPLEAAIDNAGYFWVAHRSDFSANILQCWTEDGTWRNGFYVGRSAPEYVDASWWIHTDDGPGHDYVQWGGFLTQAFHRTSGLFARSELGWYYPRDNYHHLEGLDFSVVWGQHGYNWLRCSRLKKWDNQWPGITYDILWETSLSTKFGNRIACDGDTRLFVYNSGGTIHCFTTAGSWVWSVDLPAGWGNIMKAVYSGHNTLYLIGSQGGAGYPNVGELNLESRTILWSYCTKGMACDIATDADGDRVAVVGDRSSGWAVAA